MNDSQMMNRGLTIWPPEEPAAAFQNPRTAFASAAAIPGRRLWNSGGVAAAYKPPPAPPPPQNRGKGRRFYPRKKPARLAPLAPRNTTSYIIRAKRAGGIASMPSPCPVTPAVLPTPRISPTPGEGVGDMAREEWGVDGYGSMKGLIRLRSPSDDDAGSRSSESDVEEHHHDFSRFEICVHAYDALESRVHAQCAQIARLEGEGEGLRDRVRLVEQEIVEIRRRLQLLETGTLRGRGDRRSTSDDSRGDDAAEVVDEGSEHDGVVEKSAGEDDDE